MDSHRSPLERIVRWVRRKLWAHRWHYRNPYDRTCSVCGRHEVEHCRPGNWNHGWWEVFDDGDEKLHYPSNAGGNAPHGDAHKGG